MSLRYQERGPCILVGTQIFNIRSITGDRLAHSSLSAPSFSPGIQREASDLQSQFRLIHQLYSVLAGFIPYHPQIPLSLVMLTRAP